MRRFLSIAIIALLGLTPLTPLLTPESDLPPCCRHHGAHHCAMAAMLAQMQQAAPSTPVFAAPGQCPLYHPGAPASAAVFVLASCPAPATIAGARDLASRTLSSAFRAAPAHSDRGPPSSC